MRSVVDPAPATPVEPVTEVLHGVEITDPYRWLEDQNSPRTRKWIEEQTAYTRAYFTAIPQRQILNRVQELLAVEVVSEPRRVGDRYFFLKREQLQEQPAIVMRDGVSGRDVLLVDPEMCGNDKRASVGIFNISSDGKLLAYTIRQNAQDAYEVGFLDVERRRELPDRLGLGFCDGLAFGPRNTGFYYSHMGLDSSSSEPRCVYWHSFGQDRAQDTEVFCAGTGSELRLHCVESKDCRYLAYLASWQSDPPRADLYIHDLAANKSPKTVFRQKQGYFFPFFLGDELICLTDFEASNRHIVAIDPHRPQSANWRVVVPESDSLIHSFALAGELIFVNYVKKIASHIEIFDSTGQRRGELPVAAQSTVGFQVWDPQSKTLFYEVTSFLRPPTISAYDTQTGSSSVWYRRRAPTDPTSVLTRQVTYRSKDETEVPMFLVSQKNRADEPLPTFLTGYGAFGATLTPQFAAYSTVLVEQGFLFAVANLRGGSELGEGWHRAGKRRNRQKAIDDFIAAAEWLVSTEHSIPGRLAIGGGSNAGLLVAAALTQRPDLFRAVVCVGPLNDMLRYHKFDRARTWIEEYGCAENEEDFEFLRKFSPFHGVQDGVAYPAVLLVSGDDDTRCNPMHARKMTARLQAATSSPHPILLDYKPNWGHIAVQPLTNRIDALTNRLAFVFHELE